MDKLKNKKLYIIVAAVLLVVIAVTLVVISSLSGQDAVSRALALGDRYLSNMDYESAIREYGRVLSVDPTNEDALSGLMLSYAGLGENEKARDIFENHLSDTKREDVLEAYGKMLEDEGDYATAIGVVKQLIKVRDADDDYTWMENIISKSMNARHDYSEGSIAAIEARDGHVNTRGNNMLGTLGTAAGLGVDSYTDVMASAEFDGRAVGVYTFGANSVVVDENGSLWIAGSNRSGQTVTGGTQMIAPAGWSKITPPSGKVIKVAGFDSTIFVLTDNGSLWLVGQNAGYVDGPVWFDNWTPISGYGKILDLQYSRDIVAFVNDEGAVYTAYANSADSSKYIYANWRIAARNVSRFSVYGSYVSWRETDGTFYSENWSVSYPESWAVMDEWGYISGYKAPYAVHSVAGMDYSMFVLSADAVLHYIANGVDTELEVNGVAEAIYTSGSSCVVELRDGGYVLFDSEGNQK